MCSLHFLQVIDRGFRFFLPLPWHGHLLPGEPGASYPLALGNLLPLRLYFPRVTDHSLCSHAEFTVTFAFVISQTPSRATGFT